MCIQIKLYNQEMQNFLNAYFHEKLEKKII